MGNCWGKEEKSGGGGKGEKILHTTNHTSLHQGILRERNLDVYQKYVEQEVLGRGSMGHVARVQVREGTEGGSAFTNSNHGNDRGHKNPKAPPSSSSSKLSERRHNKVDYALKSIILDRVSPQFVEELKNEIDILKGMVGTRWSLVGRQAIK